MADLSDVLIDVWNQVMVHDATIVKLGGAQFPVIINIKDKGPPGEIRTPDPLVRSSGVLPNLLEHKAESFGTSWHTTTENHEVRELSRGLISVLSNLWSIYSPQNYPQQGHASGQKIGIFGGFYG